VLLAVVAGTSLGLAAVLPPLFIVVATRGLVSSNATVLGVERAPAAGSASLCHAGVVADKGRVRDEP
jgi:DHA1 family bicyclomycin/chloramphenicol resistance-like MFS transporter